MNRLVLSRTTIDCVVDLSRIISQCLCVCSALSACSNLRTLRLSSCGVGDGRGLLRCPTLQHFEVSECRFLPNLRGVNECTSLTSVMLSDCPALRDISALSKCAALTRFHVTFCPLLQDLTPLSGCPNLSSLHVRGCANLRGSAVRKYQSLRKIHMVSGNCSCSLACPT